MKHILSKLKKPLVLSLLICTTLSQSVSASIKFKDVANNHWAYNYITFVYERGLMVGDTSGNFKPDYLIDKFQTAKILARITGYKYSGATASEEQYFQKVYEKNKVLLNQFSAKFSKWDKSSDREIAFLLEKQILNVDDLNQFVVIMSDGSQKVRALSREEAAMFFVKAVGKNEEALTSSFDFKYSDDSKMTEIYKPYIYYFENAGVFTPDTAKLFNPKSGLTRAMMATMLEKIYSLDETINIDDNDTPLGSIDDDDSNGTVNIVSINGVVDKYYPQVNALQVVMTDGNKIIYKLSDGFSLHINGFLKTVSDLEMGMNFTAVLNDSDIVSMVITSTNNNSNNNSNTNSGNNNNSSNDENINFPDDNNNNSGNNNNNDSSNNNNSNNNDLNSTTSVNGIITNVSDLHNTIDLLIVMQIGDEVFLDTQTYSFANNSKITKNNETIDVKDLKSGDNFRGAVSDKIVSLDIYKDNLKFSGTLIDKQLAPKTNKPILVVKFSNQLYVFNIDATSALSRKGIGRIQWNELRIGDTLDLEAANGTIKDIYASGTINYVEGVVDNLYLSNTKSKVTIRDNFNNLTNYNIIPNTVDMYSLRIGSRVKLKLDSKEVIGITLLSGTSNSINASVESTGNSWLKVKDASFNYSTRTVSVNGNTIIIDSKTGRSVPFTSIKANSQVYIVLSDYSSNVAKTITIL